MKHIFILIFITSICLSQSYNHTISDKILSASYFTDFYSLNYTYQFSQNMDISPSVQYFENSLYEGKMNFKNPSFVLDTHYYLIELGTINISPFIGLLGSYTIAEDILGNELNDTSVAYRFGSLLEIYVHSRYGIHINAAQNNYFHSKFYKNSFQVSAGITIKVN